VVFSAHQLPRLGEMTEHLSQIERVAVGVAPQRARQLQPVAVERLPGHRFDHLDDVGLLEPVERHAVRECLSMQRGEKLREVRRRSDFAIPEGRDHLEPQASRRLQHVTQEEQARFVGPVQVVEEQHDRCRRARCFEERHDGREEQVAIGFRIGLHAGRQHGMTVEHLPHEAGKIGELPRADLVQHRLGHMGHEVSEGFDPGLIRNRDVLVAASEQDRGTFVVGDQRGRCRQTRLADPGLAGHQRHGARAGRHHLELPGQPRALVGPTRESDQHR
jgi:hypothetical protein